MLPKKQISIYLTRLNLQKSESFRPSIKIPNLVEFAVVHFMTFQNQFNISLKSKFKASFQKIRLVSQKVFTVNRIWKQRKAEKAKDNITKVIEHGLLKLQMIQMEMVNTINNAEKVANMADSLNLIGPAGRRLYGAVKGISLKHYI